MDYLDTHYYQLNRKLLLIVGQWPYQRYGDRMKVWIFYLLIILSAVLTQVAKMLTAEVDFDMGVEILSDFLVDLLAMVRYFLHTIHNENVKTLVEKIKLTWDSLLDEDEHELFGQVAEDGRLYGYNYLIFVYSSFTIAGLTLFSQPLLKYFRLLNDSHSGHLLYPAEYFVDERKYYYLILGHMCFVLVVQVSVVIACDTCVMMFMHHTVGMFKLACHRMEHAFDRWNEKDSCATGRSNICRKIGSAVHSHRQATRFSDTLCETLAWPNFISILLVLTNITVTLYWAATSKGQGAKMILGILFGVTQMVHILTLEVAAQKITDSSEEIIYKA